MFFFFFSQLMDISMFLTVHAGCYVINKAIEYRDAAMFTKSGYQCVPWNDALDQTISPTTHPSAGMQCELTPWALLF